MQQKTLSCDTVDVLPHMVLCFCLDTGIAIGHVYYFLEDVFPEQPGGVKLLRTPNFV